ncbi:hypothetical protein BCR37DRAFT_276193 [Protomyces lactucae-debilis]|uniref:Uncharacterized protein n=1 Tax=Protomyces lactucae-debilis TaxID=2754530 RepID=A0A1Y2FIC5_PROLT|nr:uncharacterized protein BCR37DRAFT_276193 [Protomyces lactucae-debilis]ORY83688.1 hypothetical protein BCR37DRAFT_276193 [Protomyces lactucae-debilis]
MPASKRTLIAASALATLTCLFVFNGVFPTVAVQDVTDAARVFEQDALAAYHQALVYSTPETHLPSYPTRSNGRKQVPMHRNPRPPVWDELPVRMDADPLSPSAAQETIPVNPLPSPTAVAPLQSEPSALQEDRQILHSAEEVTAPFSNNEAAEASGPRDSTVVYNVTPEDLEDFVAMAGEGASFAF